MQKDVRILLGSESDKSNANVILEVLKTVGITYGVSVISCHRNAGAGFNNFVYNIEEEIIVFMGGMSLAAPGLIESLLKNDGKLNQIVFAIPTDKAARSAIEDLPIGTAIITSGLNSISLKHSLTNSALAIARLSLMLKKDTIIGLKEYYKTLNEQKPLIKEVELNEGLIP